MNIENIKPIIVFSHERSGTHFLMNSISLNFPFYVSHPWTDVDYLWEPYKPQRMIEDIFTASQEQPRNIMKAHYNYDFVSPFMEYLVDNFNVIYIMRSFPGCMRSFYRHIQSVNKELVGGPFADNWREFVQCEPMGSMMRYQMRQYPTIAMRWMSHVAGWYRNPFRDKMAIVTYHGLKDDFETTIHNLGLFLYMETEFNMIRKPPKDKGFVIDGHFQPER